MRVMDARYVITIIVKILERVLHYSNIRKVYTVLRKPESVAQQLQKKHWSKLTLPQKLLPIEYQQLDH